MCAVRRKEGERHHHCYMSTLASQTAATRRPRLHVCILHSERLTARAPNVAKLRAAFEGAPWLDATVEVITAHEPPTFSSTNIQRFVNISAAGLAEPYDKLAAPFHVHHLSNALKHHAALASAAAHPDADALLVLEDDALFSDNMSAMLATTLRAAPADWEAVFLGLPSTLKPAASGAPQFEPLAAVFKIVPGCDSYLLRPAVAARLAAAFLPVRFVTHVHLSWLLSAAAGAPTAVAAGAPVRAYVTTPNLFVDGTKLGVYISAIEVNNRLLWNAQYMALEGRVRRQETLTDADREAIAKALGEAHFQAHPDVVYLRGLFEMRCGRHAAARELFEQALRVLEAEGSVLNRGSELLANYCELYRHLQPPDAPDTPNAVAVAAAAVETAA